MRREQQPYNRYRERLAQLSTDRLIRPYLDLANDAAKSVDDSQCNSAPWSRTYGRFSPPEMWKTDKQSQHQPIVTLLYERFAPQQQIRTVELFEDQPERRIEEEIRFHVAQLGWLRVTPFPYDPPLSTLNEVIASIEKPLVVRYRPGKRCTIRCGMPQGSNAHFAKVFADQRGEEIHNESFHLCHASKEGYLHFAVAKPIAWDAATQTLWQEPVPGAPVLKRLFSAQGPGLAARMGAAAASMTNASFQPRQETDAKRLLKRLSKNATRMSKLFPQLAPLISDILQKLTLIYTGVDEEQLRPIHGAPHAKQWLDDGKTLGLVDFDGLAIGPPELDVATFMTEMDFENPRRVPIRAINAHFLAAYEDIYGPLNRDLLTAYRVHKRLGKAQRKAYALRSDSDARVEKVLRDALRFLTFNTEKVQ